MLPRYRAPAVRVASARPAALAWGLALLLAWLWLLLGLWAAPEAAGMGRKLLACALAVAAGAGLWQGWQAVLVTVLAWDGAQWWMYTPGKGAPAAALAAEVSVGLDGGHWLWLRVRVKPGQARNCNARSAGHPRWQALRAWCWPELYWLCLQRQHSPGLWGNLRRAVYSPAIPPAGL